MKKLICLLLGHKYKAIPKHHYVLSNCQRCDKDLTGEILTVFPNCSNFKNNSLTK